MFQLDLLSTVQVCELNVLASSAVQRVLSSSTVPSSGVRVSSDVHGLLASPAILSVLASSAVHNAFASSAVHSAGVQARYTVLVF